MLSLLLFRSPERGTPKSLASHHIFDQSKYPVKRSFNSPKQNQPSGTPVPSGYATWGGGSTSTKQASQEKNAHKLIFLSGYRLASSDFRKRLEYTWGVGRSQPRLLSSFSSRSLDKHPTSLAPPNCEWGGVKDFHSSVLPNSFLSSGSFPPTKLHPRGDTPLLYL